jgi:hypothetical protein
MCQFSSTLLFAYSELTSFVLQSQRNGENAHLLKSLAILRKGLMTLTLWTNTPLIHDPSENLEETDEEFPPSQLHNYESWVSFLQLSSQVVSLDTIVERLLSVERWEESAIAQTTQLVIPILLEIFFGLQMGDDVAHIAMECLSSSFELIAGVLTAAKVIYLPNYSRQLSPTASAFVQQSLWSIFGCLDLVVNRFLSLLKVLPSLTTMSFQEYLLTTASQGPFELLSLLRALSSSLQLSEQSCYYNLTESIGLFLEGHLVSDDFLSSAPPDFCRLSFWVPLMR